MEQKEEEGRQTDQSSRLYLSFYHSFLLMYCKIYSLLFLSVSQHQSICTALLRRTWRKQNRTATHNCIWSSLTAGLPRLDWGQNITGLLYLRLTMGKSISTDLKDQCPRLTFHNIALRNFKKACKMQTPSSKATINLTSNFLIISLFTKSFPFFLWFL